MKLNQKIIDAASKLLENKAKDYLWYTDTPDEPFEYSEGSIWLINPETGEWILELTKSGELWYDYETPDSFYKYLNMERSDFESFIKTWMENTLKKGVDSTGGVCGRLAGEMEDVLNRGVSSTISEWEGIQRHQGVKDALNRGVVSVIRNEINWDDEIKDVLENGKQLNKNENIFEY